MFSHNASENPYWENPKWYNRDRGLFLKYQPLIKRVAEAGWQPVTGARCGNKNIWVERFGDFRKNGCYLTVYNDSQETQTGSLVLDMSIIPISPARLSELVSGGVIARKGGAYPVTIPPKCVRVVQIK
jgi:hypothetical protein